MLARSKHVFLHEGTGLPAAAAAALIVMGTVSSLLRRGAAVKPIPRCEEGKQAVYAVMSLQEEEGLGPEARGDWFMSSGRRQRGWSCAVSRAFEAAAYAYVLAENWRKAALTFSEQAAYDLQFGDEHELTAASALLRSAKCYFQIEDKEEGEFAATKHALKKAIALFVKKNNLLLAAKSCVELAELYLQHHQLRNASDSYEQAADYYGANRRRNRYCRFKANLLRFTAANEEVLCAMGMVPVKECKRRSSRHIKSSDPDWRARVRHLFSSTSIIQQPWM
ncbi:alpha-soluble NSF attachment protein-like [Panicum miliaceum]|uniref:Alpha-soluble NSF attachment protein-like n=1 Tax=Panicum miliaceum TaxID=4540 RepID=A0A3L6TCV2_PANMI|nr:alpha-soluble NSF attachment protein-like [Panicum miliaceum]